MVSGLKLRALGFPEYLVYVKRVYVALGAFPSTGAGLIKTTLHQHYHEPVKYNAGRVAIGDVPAHVHCREHEEIAL